MKERFERDMTKGNPKNRGSVQYMFSSDFVELIIDRTDLVRIDFEVEVK